jgi:hypothetical protein
MYEAEDLGDANDAALAHSGLGERDASSKVKNKIRKMNMPLEKRFQMEEEEEEAVKPKLKVTNKGGAKELTYVPINAKKKREEEKKREEDSNGRGGRSKGQRRGDKDLGFKSPFKNR